MRSRPDSPVRDPHFPALHLRPPRNWVNDPNGLVFHDGWYHVFCQYNPNSARHSNMHWAHFRSRDLLHWELMPIALAPTPDGEDAEGVWSGNAVSLDGRLVAFYAAKRLDRWYQPVASAVSRDGLTFTKRNRLVIAEPPEGLTMFRDPYVWRDRTRWRMLVGAALRGGQGAAVQYESAGLDDLENWTYRGIFHSGSPEDLPGGGNTEEGWECAQYASFDDGHGALFVSAWDPDAGAACAVAWAGHEEQGVFRAGTPHRLDYGPDFYAPALLPAPDGRTLMWSWIWEARDENRVGARSEWTETVGWAGMLSVPREVTLGNDGTVHQWPVRELEKLRGTRRVEAAGEGPAELGTIGRAADVTAHLDGPGGLRVVTSADGREYLDIRRDPDTGEVVVDRDHASLDRRAKRGSWRLPAVTGAGELRIVLDHSVAEIFSAGRALTVRFYPVSGDAWRLQTIGETKYIVEAWDIDALEITDLRPEPNGCAQ